MTATSTLRGHPIYYDDYCDCWRYADNHERTVASFYLRDWCGHCGAKDTPQGYDGCLGRLPGVANACCGHGSPSHAYVQFNNGVILRGFNTIEIENLREEAQ